MPGDPPNEGKYLLGADDDDDDAAADAAAQRNLDTWSRLAEEDKQQRMSAIMNAVVASTGNLLEWFGEWC